MTSRPASPTTTAARRFLIGALTAVAVATGCTSTPSDTAPETASTQPVETAVVTTIPLATTTSTTTTTAPSTTTTAAPSTTTTVPTTSTKPPDITATTTAPPDDNDPPEITITSPGDLSSHVAAYDPDLNSFRAVVSMSAAATDPDSDEITIDWHSSVSGYLGTGEFITASLVTIFDSSQPYITARATDEHGAVSEASIQVIVWVPSDT